EEVGVGCGGSRESIKRVSSVLRLETLNHVATVRPALAAKHNSSSTRKELSGFCSSRTPIQN
ncbi:MAG: hypothetical protein WBP41_21630, partial [Saprospiraceae bacterium]